MSQALKVMKCSFGHRLTEMEKSVSESIDVVVVLSLIIDGKGVGKGGATIVVLTCICFFS